MAVSRTTLKLLAMLTWITGGAVLFFKGYALVSEALAMKPGAPLSYLPFPIAAALGSIKARYLFLSSCRKNLARIDALVDPKAWQFFRPVFFFFLLTMISLGMYLSRWAAGNYSALITVASIDLALSVALFGSLGGFKQYPVSSTQYPVEKDVSG